PDQKGEPMKIQWALVWLFTCLVACVSPKPQTKSAGHVTAFVGVTVIAMDSDRAASDQTVVVDGSQIVAVGPTSSVEVPAGATRIDGKGKYLMPGLADMHVHLFEEEEMILYVANG